MKNIKNRIRLLLLATLGMSGIVTAQKYEGTVIDSLTNKAIEYVNIGVIGKGVGTTSDANGLYALQLDEVYDNDSLRFSSIGYESRCFKVKDFKAAKQTHIKLQQRIGTIAEVLVFPKEYKRKIFGYTTRSRFMQAGFDRCALGYECGIRVKTSKIARLKTLVINVARCSYDTVFCRINVYKLEDNREYQNVLLKPIYFRVAKDEIRGSITVDLSEHAICISGEYLVCVEYVKDLGQGLFMFSAGLVGKTFCRQTSQANWQTAPVGIGMYVEADVER